MFSKRNWLGYLATISGVLLAGVACFVAADWTELEGAPRAILPPFALAGSIGAFTQGWRNLHGRAS